MNHLLEIVFNEKYLRVSLYFQVLSICLIALTFVAVFIISNPKTYRQLFYAIKLLSFIFFVNFLYVFIGYFLVQNFASEIGAYYISFWQY
jgi:hypothetical protein